MRVAAICGQVREPKIFVLVVNELLKARQLGVVDRVFVSTWQEEVDKFPELFSSCRSAGIEFCTAPEPQTFRHGFQVHQRLHIERVLFELPDQAIVLKTRTDCVLEGSHLGPVFEGIGANWPAPPNSTILADAPDAGFRGRVWVPSLEVYTPFFISDYVYCGYACDLRRMQYRDYSHNPVEIRFFDDYGDRVAARNSRAEAHFEWPEGAKSTNYPMWEQLLFTEPFFRSHYSIVDEIREFFPLVSSMTTNRSAALRELCVSAIWWEWIAFYWGAVLRNFLVGRDCYAGSLQFFNQKYLEESRLSGSYVYEELMTIHDMDGLFGGDLPLMVDFNRICAGVVLLTSADKLGNLLLSESRVRPVFAHALASAVKHLRDEQRINALADLRKRLQAIKSVPEKHLNTWKTR